MKNPFRRRDMVEDSALMPVALVFCIMLAAFFYLVVTQPVNTTQTIIIKETIPPTTIQTTTTTTTSTTTSTTTIPVPPKPTKSDLVSKVEEFYPGSTETYSSKTIEEGGKMACLMWNSVAGVSRMSVIREVTKVTGINDSNLSAVISQAVLWTICPSTATFPNGPRDFDMGLS